MTYSFLLLVLKDRIIQYFEIFLTHVNDVKSLLFLFIKEDSLTSLGDFVLG